MTRDPTMTADDHQLGEIGTEATLHSCDQLGRVLRKQCKVIGGAIRRPCW